jgi:glycosyltransferase involved in cell wall biosynthesis
LRLLKGQKRGIADARNEAARHATSPWLIFLDADDLLRPDHLVITLTAAEAKPTPDMLYGAGAKLTPDGRLPNAEFPKWT